MDSVLNFDISDPKAIAQQLSCARIDFPGHLCMPLTDNFLPGEINSPFELLPIVYVPLRAATIDSVYFSALGWDGDTPTPAAPDAHADYGVVPALYDSLPPYSSFTHDWSYYTFGRAAILVAFANGAPLTKMRVPPALPGWQ